MKNDPNGGHAGQLQCRAFSAKAAVFGEEVEGKATPISLLGVFTAIPKGLADSSVLNFFVFIIGALFTLIHHTSLSMRCFFPDHIIQRTSSVAVLFRLPVGIFWIGIHGYRLRTIPFPVFLFLSKRMGYDRVFGVGLICCPGFIGLEYGE
ncbi:MAG: hypothetical protein R2788_01865 [Saprospiraceae bacterium]